MIRPHGAAAAKARFASLREAAQQSAAQEVRAALAAYDRRGFVRLQPSEAQGKAAIASALFAVRDQGERDYAVYAFTNADVSDLNCVIRGELVRRGQPGSQGPNLEIGGAGFTAGDSTILCRKDRRGKSRAGQQERNELRQPLHASSLVRETTGAAAPDSTLPAFLTRTAGPGAARICIAAGLASSLMLLVACDDSPREEPPGEFRKVESESPQDYWSPAPKPAAMQAPVDTDATPNEITFDAVSGTHVGLVAQAQSPAGKRVIYRLSDDANGAFFIDPDSGAVFLADAAALGNGDAFSVNITVEASDLDGATASSVFTVRLLPMPEGLDDLGDLPPPPRTHVPRMAHTKQRAPSPIDGRGKWPR